ncbi:PucR family transcriptional regulator [Corynebacterium sp.]|uniref:PucR family transcriptional regulator n=1 Tax=Corynebacterium sp. TaxID=1720 RepID=UPI0026DD0BF5|nr:PucR family transcriptional regulator [Corynebacterium sp.]MDO5032128.1 PucR family transcriptional regulator ligand-binding domain-containing protein [Corynebacterium sp.]
MSAPHSRAFAPEEPENLLSFDWLAASEELGLEVFHNSGAQFSVVHPCELEDPREFVHAGAIIVLTGIAFTGRPEALAEYTRAMAAHGVAGIGLGVGLVFDAVPESMIAAARESNISLFSVPREVPFVSLLAAVHDELVERRQAALAAFIESQEQLNAAAARGLDSLLGETAALIDAHVALADFEGRVFSQAENTRLGAVTFAPIIEAARDRNFSVAGKTGQWWTIAQRLATRGDNSFGIVAAALEPFTQNQRALLKQAAGLAELMVKRPQELRAAQGELNRLAIAIQLGLEQTEDPMKHIFRTVGDAEGRVRPLLIKSENPRRHRRFAEELDARLADHGRLLFLLDLDEETSVVLFRGSRTMKNIQDLLRDIRGNKRVVVGAPIPWKELSMSLVKEMESVAFGLQPGMLVGPESRTLTWVNDERIRDVIEYRVEETWRKLREYDAAHGTEMERTLEMLLRNGGHVSRTADAMNAHRHTIRKRVADLEDLLELDLKDPVVAAELLILGIAAVD